MSYQGRRIGLALSGGGFRATLFHLGVVRFLHEAGALKSVKLVSAVSGGSILAAHLVLFWEKYTESNESFDIVAGHVINFVQQDIRGSVLRDWITFWVVLFPHLSPKKKRPTLGNLLQRKYNGGLYHGVRIGEVPTLDHPEVRLNCTSLTTGCPCYFNQSGFTWSDKDGKRTPIRAMDLPLAYAVAASSAFPPLFPPIEISNRILSCDQADFPNALRLTDGGVYDNLGIESLDLGARDDIDCVIISDAEGNFDSNFRAKYSFVVGRNVRANDLLMKQVSTRRLKDLDASDVLYARIEIGGAIDNLADSANLAPDLQRTLINVRTDLDQFLPHEITALIAHGYNKARWALIEKKLVSDDAPRFSWDPLQNWANLQLPGASAGFDFEGSRISKWRLWTPLDPKSWVTAFWIFVSVPILIAVANQWMQRVTGVSLNTFLGPWYRLYNALIP
jgi:predicted acylesterase/phospholipase RssA